MMSSLYEQLGHIVYAVRSSVGCFILGHVMTGWTDTLLGHWRRSCVYCGKAERRAYVDAVLQRNADHS